MEVGADRNGGSEARSDDGFAKAMGELFGWSEETFGTGYVENEGAGVDCEDFFDARGELRQGFKKYGSGSGFGFGGAREDVNVAEFFDFEARHAGDDSALSGMSVESADTLLRRRSIKNDNWSGLKIGAQAQDGLRGEFRDMNGCVEALGIHARLAASHAAWAVHVEAGGLRSIDVMWEKRSRWRWTL